MSLIKIAVLAFIFLVAQAQNVTIPTPDPSWDDYQVKSCCPKGFLEVSNYCVQCSAPNVFDSISQVCRPCPTGQSYNNATKACDCTVPCAAPRALDSNNQCNCPADQKGNVKTWDQTANTCNCPANLPLWNGKYCVACPAGTEFDPKEKQCYHCPEGFVRDIITHNCVPGM